MAEAYVSSQNLQTTNQEMVDRERVANNIASLVSGIPTTLFIYLFSLSIFVQSGLD